MRFAGNLVALLAFFPGSGSAAGASSSFGPEISAEDFNQHLWALRSPGFAASGDAAFGERHPGLYLQVQFERLGLSAQQMVCSGKVHGLQAILPGSVPDNGNVVYLAQWHDAYASAGVLEIAERFMTQKPRPKHDVTFIFLNQDAAGLAKCPQWRNAAIIQPKGLNGLDSAELVRKLAGLQALGK